MTTRYEIRDLPGLPPGSAQCWRQQHPAESADPPAVTVLPALSLDLVINRGDSLTIEDGRRSTLPGVHLVGPLTRPIRVRATGATDLVIVRFRPWLLDAICDLPLPELADRIIDGSELDPNIRGPYPDLMRTLARRFAEVSIDKGVIAGLRQIIDSRGQASVSALARRLDISARQLRRRFRDKLGYGPKTASSIVQCQWALDLLRRSMAPAQAAVEGGFTDQAHLTHRIRRVMGTTPGALSSFRPTPLHARFNDNPGTSGIYKTAYL